MHPILLKVQKYLADVGAGRAEPVSHQLLYDFAKANVETLTKTFSKKSEKFRLRMSNVGRPTCQLQFENVGATGEEAPYYSEFRNVYGDLTEALAVLVLKAAGVNVVAVQRQVALKIAGTEISGTLDLLIDEGDGEKVWDIKSASKWAFNHKWKDFGSVVEDDSFGYVGQGYGYAEAVRKPFGGWIVVCKETGEWTVVPVPLNDDHIRRKALAEIEHNIITIRESHPFQRSFSDFPEIFRRQPTGNRVLGITCSFCPFKQHCWPDLKFQPSVVSESKNPKKVWYTKLTEEYKNASKQAVSE